MLKKYLTYFAIMTVGICLYLFAILPVWKFNPEITNVLTNEDSNSFLIAIGTGIIGSVVTALLIDRSNEKREIKHNCEMKSIMLSELIYNLKFLMTLTYGDALMAQQTKGFLDKLVNESIRAKNCSWCYVNVDEYNAISQIESVVVDIREKLNADYNNYSKYIREYDFLFENYFKGKRGVKEQEYVNIMEEMFGLDEETTERIYLNIVFFDKGNKVIEMCLAYFDNLDSNIMSQLWC